MSPRVGSPAPSVSSASNERRKPSEPGLVDARCLVADEATPPIVVVGREERFDRHVGVAVERVAIRERELRALRDDVDELGLRELGEVESLEQGELLKPDGARRPRPRLADGEPAVLERDDGLERGLPGGQVAHRSGSPSSCSQKRSISSATNPS